MRARLSLLIVLPGALALSLAPCGAEIPPVVAAAEATEFLEISARYGLGTTRGVVLLALGSPSVELSPNVWVYQNYRPSDPAPRRQGFDTLVMVFEEDRVARLRLVNGKTLAAHVAYQRKLRQQELLAARTPPAKP